jgi:hypothetical protein
MKRIPITEGPTEGAWLTDELKWVYPPQELLTNTKNALMMGFAQEMYQALELRDEFERHVFECSALDHSRRFCPVCADLEKREQAAREAVLEKVRGHKAKD